MSRRDSRKALVVALPPSLRRALRARARPGDGLAATARRLLRAADLAPVVPVDLPRGAGRPLILQLSKAERARLDALASRLAIPEADALCYALVAQLGPDAS